ncbi:DUF3472 domain-containing protein [Lysobacter sp. Hz 25]|uniref:DUF3472 domain-containing protein n=1 Tax=Lysobacter sp. Hz 25 TaxID=3383698 RepID=UPI0038D4C4D2
MKKLALTGLIAAACMLIGPTAQAVVVGGIVSTDAHWPATTAGYNQLTFYDQVNHDGGSRSNYYWANQFWFHGGDGGYIGLQNRSGQRWLNFSIWLASGWDASSRASCGHFSHEGSGVQCQIKWNWKPGHKYKVDVIRASTKVTGVVTDLMTGESITVATINIPATWSGFKSQTVSFVEEYSQGANQLPSCNVIGAQSSVFYLPVANGNLPATSQTTKTYGNCNDKNIAHAACDSTGKCMNIVSNLDGYASPSE